MTYFVAALLGLSTCLLFGSNGTVPGVFETITSVLISIGMYLLSPIILFSFPAGIASLGKDKLGGKFSDRVVTWTLLSSIALPLVAALLFFIFPSPFPVTSGAGSEGDIAGRYIEMASNEALSSLLVHNPTYTMLFSVKFILPLVLVAWVFGLALRPKSDIIRPAYAVMNSFSEVMMKISKVMTLFGFVTVYFASSNFFMTIFNDKSIFVSPAFLFLIVLVPLVMLLIVIPLLFLIVTGGKANPWKCLSSSLSVLFHSLFTGNIIASGQVMISIERHNLGVQKRIATTATPIFSIFMHGGSAAIATITTLSLIYAFTNTMDISVVMAVALISIPISFASSPFVSFETVMIGYAATKLLNIELYGAESAIFAILPLVNGIGTMIDASLQTLGAKAVAVKLRTSLEVPRKDKI